MVSFSRKKSSLSSPSSNWKLLKSQLPTTRIKKSTVPLDRLEQDDQTSRKLLNILHNNKGNPSAINQTEIGKYLAIDCEMVGVGPAGSQSVLARVSIVNYYGNLILDQYVKPKEKVTDYRTWISGIKPEHLENADSFELVTRRVANLIKDKVLVGHAISNDLEALLLTHPRHLIRDTSTYTPLRKLAKTKQPSLKKLARLVLDVEIQSGSHSSVDDARATLAIYRTQKDLWETLVKKQQLAQQARKKTRKEKI